MSMTGLEVFDKTLQTTNVWLNEISEEMGGSKQRAYHALTAVLWSLRDRLQIEDSAHLAAQLPLMVKGIYFHGWNPTVQPNKIRSQEEFLENVEARLHDIRPMDPKDAVSAVFMVLGQHISEGEADKVTQALPKDIRKLWPEGMMKPPPQKPWSSDQAQWP